MEIGDRTDTDSRSGTPLSAPLPPCFSPIMPRSVERPATRKICQACAPPRRPRPPNPTAQRLYKFFRLQHNPPPGHDVAAPPSRHSRQPASHRASGATPPVAGQRRPRERVGCPSGPGPPLLRAGAWPRTCGHERGTPRGTGGLPATTLQTKAAAPTSPSLGTHPRPTRACRSSPAGHLSRESTDD